MTAHMTYMEGDNKTANFTKSTGKNKTEKGNITIQSQVESMG